MRKIHYSPACITICLALFSAVLASQEPNRVERIDTIIGKVNASDSTAYKRITVEVQDSLHANKKSIIGVSPDGSYWAAILGSGIYRIKVRAIGFEPKDTTVHRSGNSSRMYVPTLSLAVASQPSALSVVNIRGAKRPRPARSIVNRNLGISSNELTSVSDAQADLDRFGLPSSQATYVFNGMDIGQDGLLFNLRGSVNSALSDYSSMGALFLNRLGDVSRTPFKRHSIEFATEPEALTWQSKDGYSSGDGRSNYRIGVTSTIPLVASRYTLTSRVQYLGGYRRMPSLKNLSAPALSRLGISSDSLARLYNILDGLAVPAGGASLSDKNADNGASVQLAFNFNPASDTVGLSGSVSFLGTVKKQSLPGGLLSLPTTNATRESQVFGLSTNLSFYIGRAIISNLEASVVNQKFTGRPSYRLPGINLQLSSTDEDDLTSFATLAMGGNNMDRSQSTTQNFRIANSFTWHPDTSRSFQRSLKFELYGSRSNAISSLNKFGTYTYYSLEELEANRPNIFSRIMNETVRKSGELRYSISLKEGRFASSASNGLSFQYVIRLEGQRVNARPTQNDTVESVFGINSTVTPRSWGVNPSFVVRKPFGKLPGRISLLKPTTRSLSGRFEISGQMVEGIVTNDRRRSIYSTSSAGASIYNLSCLGAAVPTPDWDDIVNGHWDGPVECSTGGGITMLGSNSRVYSAFDRSYRVPRGFRTTVSVPLNLHPLAWIEPSVSFVQNTKMESESDINFSGVQSFTLSNEAERPVFVPTSAILPQTGQISPVGGRLDSRFDRVRLIKSDGRSSAINYTLSVYPEVNGHSYFNWNLTYMYHSGSVVSRGFNATTAADPRVLSRHMSRTPAHGLDATIRYRPSRSLTVASVWRIESGQKFTPLVIGDINGDGYSNDRAFVFDPANASTDPVVAAGVSSLLNSAPSSVRSCLKSQLNTIANANSCTGPWSFNLDLQFSFALANNLEIKRIRIDFINTLSGLDRMINGWEGMKGWGQARSVDQSLLRVVGFKPLTQEFQYEVNSRFGTARSTANAIRAPFAIAISGQIPIGAPLEKTIISRLPATLKSYADTAVFHRQIYFAYAGTAFSSIQMVKMTLVDSLNLSDSQREKVLHLANTVLDSATALWRGVSHELMKLEGPGLFKKMKDLSSSGKQQSRSLLYYFGREMRNILDPHQWMLINPLIQQGWDPRWSLY